MGRRRILFPVLALLAFSAAAQTRSFDDIFPALEGELRERVFSPSGLGFSSEGRPVFRLLPEDGFGMEGAGRALNRNLSFLVESLQVIPFEGFTADLADIYYALGRIRDLKGRLYHSATRDKDTPLFEDATRIEGPQKHSPVADPPRQAVVPPGETVYLRLKDVNFGNSYYRAEISSNVRGLLYTMTNFRNLSYLVIPVIKEDKFVAQLYLEPVAEGILIYGAAGAEVSDFIASRIHIPSAVRKRLEVIIDWVRAGIRGS